MTYETYENLSRVQRKRQLQGVSRGDWIAVADAVKQINRLNTEMAESISPLPFGHPDNPFLSKK